MDVNAFLKSPTPDIYHTLPHITLDAETTNLDYGSALVEENDILLLSMIEDGEINSVWSGALDFSPDIIDRLEGDVILVGHNIKFDLQWLMRCGLDPSKVLVWDTMLAEKVLLGNNPLRLPLDLGNVAKRYGYTGKEPVVDKLMKMGVCPSNISPKMLQRRCEYDVSVTQAVFLKQRAIATETGKLGVVLTRCIFTPVLAEIEFNGMCLDKDRVLAEWKRATEEVDECRKQLVDIADINWNSSQQKAEVIYEHLGFKPLRKWGEVVTTDGGALPTNADTIAKLSATNKVQRNFKEVIKKYGSLKAQLTKALNQMKACVEADELLHFQFSQHITQTHRTSSNGRKYKLQGQNIPRIFKKLFRARQEGWYMVEGDGANLEFRVAVELGDDEQGRIDISDPDFDAHTRTASVINNEEYEQLRLRVKAEDKIAKEFRQNAKADTFKPLFGGKSGTKEQQAYYQSFNDRYSGVTAVQDAWKWEALTTKKVRMPWGLEWFFPTTKMNKEYQTESTKICNYPIQSFATADIIPIALTYLWHSMKQEKLSAFLVGTVHDSGVAEAPIEEKEVLNELFVRSFTESCYNYIKDVYNMDFATPLGVGIKWGNYWSEGEEISIDVPNTRLTK